MTKDTIRYLVSSNHSSLARYLQSQLIIGEEPFLKDKGTSIFAFYTPPRSDIASAIQEHTFDFVCLNERRFRKKKENQNWREYILRGDEIVGHLELVDISNERSVMFFVFSPDKFQPALSKILNLVSAVWSINELEVEQSTESKSNTEDQSRKPSFYIEGWKKLPWDDYAIEHWHKGESATKICKGIREKRLGDISNRRLYNRMSYLRTRFPVLKIERRR